MAKGTEVVKLESLEKLQKEVSVIAANCNIVVIDDTTEKIAEQIARDAKVLNENIETARKSLKEPYLEIGRKIDDRAKLIRKPLEDGLAVIKNSLLKYRQEKAARIAERQRVLEEERAKAQAKADAAKTDKTREKYDEKTYQATSELVVISQTDTGLGKRWDYRVLDIKQVPAEYLEINAGAVRSAMSNRDETGKPLPVAGLEFYQKETVKI
jgi:hypothetical protein